MYHVDLNTQAMLLSMVHSICVGQINTDSLDFQLVHFLPILWK